MNPKTYLFVALAGTLLLAGCGAARPAAPTAKVSPTPLASPAPGGSSTSPAQQGVTVTVQSPQPGATPNNISVRASATSPDGIAGWAVYADDKTVYQTSVPSDSLSTEVTLGAGAHMMYLRAWDKDGTTFGTSPTLQLTVGGSGANALSAPNSPPEESGLPTPPASAIVMDNLQNTTDGWSSCSLCAEGTNSTDNYWMAPFESTPSMSGSSRHLFIGGPQWSNALFIKTMPGHTDVSHFLWDFWVYHDEATAANIWTAEFDLFQFSGGQEFMVGTQCAFGDRVWDTWDQKNNKWIQTDIPCPRWAPNTWHHVQWWVERLPDNKYRYNTLVVDGHPYTVDQTYETSATAWRDAIGVQWQLDEDSSGTPLHQWIDNVKLTMW